MSYTRSKSARKKRRATTVKSRAADSATSSSSVADKDDFRITESCGNIFEDMGFPSDEARRLLLRSQLAVVVMDLVEQRRLTQAAAAKLLGITQPRLNDLLRGRVDKFSIDMLIKMLSRAGLEVSVVVRSTAAWPARTDTTPATRTRRTSA